MVRAVQMSKWLLCMTDADRLRRRPLRRAEIRQTVDLQCPIVLRHLVAGLVVRDPG